MTADFDSETLIAYVDGELGPDACRAVEAAAIANKDLRARLDALRCEAAAIGAAFDDALRAPVPVRLTDTVDRGFARRRDQPQSDAPRRPVSRWRYLAPIAASLAIVTVGLTGAYVITDRLVERKFARLEAARAADRALIAAAISQALEHYVSGKVARWENPDSGSSGRVKPVRTFRISDGKWCREYVMTADFNGRGARRESRRAIACRESDGRWKTRLQITGES